jgi:methyl-accepting chemotaxis protein
MKKLRLGLKARIILVVLLPLIATAISGVIVMSHIMVSNVNTQIMRELRAAAISGVQTFDMSDMGDYAKGSDGKVTKGNIVISDNFDIIDRFKEKTDLDATFFYGNERIITTILDSSGNRILGTKIDEKIVDQVINQKKDYFTSDIKIEGVDYYGFYTPIVQQSTGEAVGMFFTGCKVDDIYNIMNSSLNYADFLPIFVVIVVGLVIATVLAFYIVNRLKRTVVSLKAIAEGDLTVNMEASILKEQTEIGDVARATEKLRASLHNVVKEIKESDTVLAESIVQVEENAFKTNEITKDVENAITQISESSSMQADNTESASNSVLKMGELIFTNAEQAQMLQQSSNEMESIGKRVVAALEELYEVNSKTQHAIDNIYDQTNATNQSVQEIKEAANFITDIAEETNLLSLNATIEAARAGENGKGFAVVAAQIQKLAEQSNESAKLISKVISTLINDSNRSVDTMVEVKSVIKEQSSNVEKTKKMFGEVEHVIRKNDEKCNLITNSTNQLNHFKDDIIEVVNKLTAIAQENAASTEETAASCEELRKTTHQAKKATEKLQRLSENLSNQIQVFTINKE